jgi:phage shock protein A
MELKMQALESEMAHVKNDVAEVKGTLTSMDGKLDKALQDKADWSAVTTLTAKIDSKADAAELKAVNEELNKRLPVWATWALTAAGGIIGVLVTIVIMLTQHFVK